MSAAPGVFSISEGYDATTQQKELFVVEEYTTRRGH